MPQTTFDGRPRVRTAFEPEDFVEAIDATDDPAERGHIRQTFRSLDDGRFYDFLDAAHNVVARSDLKRRRAFAESYSDHLIRWIQAFGAVEELNRFPELSD